jgi:hypothetical protein
MRRCDVLVLVVLVVAAVAAGPGACGWLPPDSPPAKPAPPDPDAGLFHDWKVADHVLGTRALISEADAAEFRDRTVAVTATAYSSPWSGSCNDMRRERQPRTLAEIAAAHDIDRARAAHLGLGEPIVEHQLLCAAGRAPALTIYTGGPSAVTCWSGVCYLLAR